MVRHRTPQVVEHGVANAGGLSGPSRISPARASDSSTKEALIMSIIYKVKDTTMQKLKKGIKLGKFILKIV